jgi:hypothetical protein
MCGHPIVGLVPPDPDNLRLNLTFLVMPPSFLFPDMGPLSDPLPARLTSLHAHQGGLQGVVVQPERGASGHVHQVEVEVEVVYGQVRQVVPHP